MTMMNHGNALAIFSVAMLVFGSLVSFQLASTDFLRNHQAAFVTTTLEDVSNQKDEQGRILLPDWRLSVDCSVFSRDCPLAKMRTHRYAEYPFRLGESDQYDWETDLPQGWNVSLAVSPTQERHSVLDLDLPNGVNACVEAALKKSVDQQLDELLSHLRRGHVTTTTSGERAIAFTISDFSYAQDMLQDVFEMSREIVLGYDGLFMVAMDRETMQLACKHDVPFLAWPLPSTDDRAQNSALKETVANTKFDVSYKLVQRNQSFFFFEMDVWFVQSPQAIIRRQTADLIFSGHQDNPNAVNIGVYSALANDATREFFRICIDVLRASPESHDQRVMQQVVWWAGEARAGKNLVDGGWLRPFKPTLPTITNPVSVDLFTAHEIASSVWPIATEETLAIHTLCGVPLRTPHGKKAIAKELGGWYGSGSYYQNAENRYLWFDGHVVNGYSTVMNWPGFYHRWDLLQWMVAATIALARRTNRIWVTPKVIHDYGIHFLWVFLDMESVEALVDVRETNFPNNAKAWHNASVPFHPVARTALAGDGRLFVQSDASQGVSSTDKTHKSNVRAWKLHMQTSFDAWFSIHNVIPELHDAQVLLSGLPAAVPLFDELTSKLRNKEDLSIAEKEIQDVWRKLRWCGAGIEHETFVGRANADMDCYGKGKALHGF